MSSVLADLFGTAETPRPPGPRSLTVEALRLDVLSSALPALPLGTRSAVAQRLGTDIRELSSPVHEGRTLRTLAEAAVMEVPDAITRNVLRALPQSSPDDKATLLEAIVSNRRCLSPATRAKDRYRTIADLFDSIRSLPEHQQFHLLTLLLHNARLLNKTYLPHVVSLRSRIVDAMQELAGKPDAAASSVAAVPRFNLPEVVESLFGGIEHPGDRQSNSDSAAKAADRLAALSAAAPAILEVATYDERAKALPKALSEHLLDRILALEKPSHRFAALSLLVSQPQDASEPDLNDAPTGPTLTYRPGMTGLLELPRLSSRGELLDAKALTRIVDAIPTLPSPHQSALLEMSIPACIKAGDQNEKKITMNRILALLSGMDREDRVAPLAKLISSHPLALLKAVDRPSIARSILRAVVEQGHDQPPALFGEFINNVLLKLAPNRQHQFMREIGQFLKASPSEFIREIKQRLNLR
ncbi:hypothetical protein LJR230_001401 [Trinickia sp. LjRoot230]|uniref:hypothetical protein n=1 Tax=Trinickia sp. LjRoot230 TaxID=3342288 RepID=UPI003ECC6BB1